MNSRPLLVRARSAAVVVLAVLLALTSGGGAHAFDWPRDPALRPVPESVVSTLDAESAMVKKLSKVLKRGGLGKSFSLRVVDVESGRVVDARDDATARIAASNTKLFTAVAALDTLGENARFTTKVTRKGKAKDVTLVGGGDMRITNAKLRSLASQTALALRAKAPGKTKGKRVVRVRLDDSRYQGAVPKLKTWREGGYRLSVIQPVRSVMRSKGRYQDAAASAARYLAKQIDKRLPTTWVVRYGGRTAGPVKAKTVAKVKSAKVGALVRRMLLVSDNQVAEGLHREIALADGRRPTFAAGAKVARLVAKSYGVPMRGSKLADGSGLSPRNTLTPVALTELLRVVADPDNTALLPILYGNGALPVAGVSGTLAAKGYYRFQQPEAHCAVGEVVAKTGSLDWERALSGFAVGEDGRLKAFSVLANGLASYDDRVEAVKTLDHVAAIVDGCAKR